METEPKETTKGVDRAILEEWGRLYNLCLQALPPESTTVGIAERLGVPTAHSPVRGNHPNLYPSIKTVFVKYVGGADENSTKLAMRHLKALGIKRVKDVGSSLNTEIGKAVNIMSYAWVIIFCKWIKSVCDKTGADFDIVYTDFLKTYNDGYKKTHPMSYSQS